MLKSKNLESGCLGWCWSLTHCVIVSTEFDLSEARFPHLQTAVWSACHIRVVVRTPEIRT